MNDPAVPTLDGVSRGDGRPRFGVEPFDVGYGASFAAEAESPLDLECEIVEDGGSLEAHHPERRQRPERLAVGDGTRPTDSRVTRTCPGGSGYTRPARAWAAGCLTAHRARAP